MDPLRAHCGLLLNFPVTETAESLIQHDAAVHSRLDNATNVMFECLILWLFYAFLILLLILFRHVFCLSALVLCGVEINLSLIN